MVDSAYILGPMSVDETLDLLSKFVSIPGSSLDLLNLSAETVLGEVRVTLYLPTKPNLSRAKLAGFTHFSNQLLDAYKLITPHAPGICDYKAPNEPFTVGLCRLFYVGLTEGTTAQIVEKERDYLLICPDIPDEDIPGLYAALHIYATSLLVAFATSRIYCGNAGEKDDAHRGWKEASKTLVFHIHCDTGRHSAFASFVQSSALDDYVLLAEYGSKTGIYAPIHFFPEEQATELYAFRQFLLKGYALFDSPAPDGTNKPLAAIAALPASGDGPTDLVFYYLAGLDYLSKIEVRNDLNPPNRVILANLSSSEDQASQLVQTLRKTVPKYQYRLSLRPTQWVSDLEGNNPHRREVLMQRKLDLEWQMSYLDSICRPRPVLLRFRQSQLGRLAKVLLALPASAIRDLQVLYAFEVSDLHPAGLHYLLFKPEFANLLDPAALIEWTVTPEYPVRFWLDPYWAYYYSDRHPDCWVFTPEWTALFPTIHSWEIDDMNVYLSKMVEHWFQEHAHPTARSINLPGNPIYVFDQHTPDGEALEVTLLDQESFQPLRHRLGWLVDNLSIAQAAQFIPKPAGRPGRAAQQISVVDQVSRAGREFILAELAQAVEERSLEQRKVFDDESRSIQELINQRTTELLQQVTAQLEITCQEAGRTGSEASALNSRIESMRQMMAHTDGTLRKAESLASEVSEQIQGAQQDSANLRNQAIGQIERLEADQRDVIKKSNEQLQALEEQRQIWLENLRRLKGN